MKKFILILSLPIVLVLGGCYSTTIDMTSLENQYRSQNYTKVNSSILLGDFTYEPARFGRLKESQLESEGLATHYFDRSIADMVKLFTKKELELTGIKVGTGRLTLLGNVKQLQMEGLGSSLEFSYTVNYKILKNGVTLWDKDYSPTKITVSGVSHDTIRIRVYRMIASAYDKFINDNGVKKLLESNK